MQQYLISFLIFIPLVAAFLALFAPASKSNFFRFLTLVVNFLQVVVAIAMIGAYVPAEAINFIEKQPWITLSLGDWGVMKAEYFVGADGLSFPLILLTILVMLIATLSSWSIRENVKGYFVLILILNARSLERLQHWIFFFSISASSSCCSQCFFLSRSGVANAESMRP